MSEPLLAITTDECQNYISGWKALQQKIAFVPTMGALHQGHLELVNVARSLADKVLVSIFVNPTQFGPNEDFEKYPRTIKADLEKLTATGKVDSVFIPNTVDIYSSGNQTFVVNDILGKELCGATRKVHFSGVLTVVLKLLMLVKPHFVVFGKKDYQQLRLVERMVKDFFLDATIVAAETVREQDGLAMSSRNQYLNAEQRTQAVTVYKALQAAKNKFVQGEKNKKTLIETFEKIIKEIPALHCEYAEIRNQSDLSLVEEIIDEKTVLLTAVRAGETRLIDNIEFSGDR